MSGTTRAQAPGTHAPSHRAEPPPAQDHGDEARKPNWARLIEVKKAKVEEYLACAPPIGENSPHPCETAEVRRLLKLTAGVLAQRPGRRRDRLRNWWTGAACDEAWRLVHEAEALAVGLLPLDRRITRMQEIMADAATILDAHDPVLQLRPTATAAGSDDGRVAPARPHRLEEPGDASPAQAAELVRRYRQAWDDRYVRSRNYRNRLIVLTITATVFLVALILIGGAGLFTITRTTPGANGQLQLEWPSWHPSVLHLVAMVAIASFGSVGGLLAGARQIVGVGGVYNPFYLPLHSLLVKIQMGALCAIAGVLAILGGVVPEINIGRWGDIAGFALVFGAAQQLVSQVIDGKVSALVTNEPRDRSEKK